MKVGIIGGTGMQDVDFLEEAETLNIKTPYGVSEAISGKIKGRDVVVVLRHGRGHKINPTNINYRANIQALKGLGVEMVFAPCAVGSLKENIKPGDLVFTDQFIDRTTKRISTFYDKGRVCHIPMSEPFCPELRAYLTKSAEKLKLPFHKSGVNIVVEGPRFSTMAESNLYRSWNMDTINMTLVPECVLAREAELCYAAIAMVTDYDNFADKPVDIKIVEETMKRNSANVKSLLAEIILSLPEERKCSCREALKDAFI